MATSAATESSRLLGLRTVIYAAPNLAELKAWYTAMLGFEPYFDEPFYVGFNVGGYELGLDPNVTLQAGSTVTYWGVASIEAAYDRIQRLGAIAADPITEVGDGVKVATVHDPAGNVLGLIENPHFSLSH